MPPVPPILSSTNSRGKIPTGAQNRGGRGGDRPRGGAGPGRQAQGGPGGGGQAQGRSKRRRQTDRNWTRQRRRQMH
jgi:hypothetical protein